MNEQATIDDPIARADDAAADICAFDDPQDGAGEDCEESFAPEAIEDSTDIPSPAFVPAKTPAMRNVAIGARLFQPAVVAVAISLFVHVNLALGVYWVTHSLHAFVPAHPQSVQGDGATALGAIDHDGNDLAPGAIGPGSLTPGWSPPPSGAMPAIEPLALDASDSPPPPASAPPPLPPPDFNNADATPAPVVADAAVSPLQPDMLPVFRHMPPPPATAPVDHAVAATPAGTTSVEVASTRPAAPATAASPSVIAGEKEPVGDDAQATTAGFSGPASDTPGGLVHHPGLGGSSGKGGATTGDGGAAVTGRPGTPAGIKGRPLHADYPDDCQRRGETGRVVIEVDVRADGSIASLKVFSDDGHPRLARAALDALEGRQFYPALLDGRPVRSTINYPFVFELR